VRKASSVVVVSGAAPIRQRLRSPLRYDKLTMSPAAHCLDCKQCGFGGRRACKVRNATGLTLCQSRARTIAQQPADPNRVR
jgi:hypothetical protein